MRGFQSLYIRGMNLGYISIIIIKQLKLKTNEPDHRIRKMKKEAILDDSKNIKHELMSLKAHYKDLSILKTENSQMHLKQTYYNQSI